MQFIIKLILNLKTCINKLDLNKLKIPTKWNNSLLDKIQDFKISLPHVVAQVWAALFFKLQNHEG